MERSATKILTTTPKLPTSDQPQTACLVHIYPVGSAMGTRYQIGQTPVVLGRDDDCDISIQDNSASRHHARIQPVEGYVIFDLQSTNGTWVNNVRVNQCKLGDGDYIRVGNCIYRFLAGGNVESAYHEEIYRLAIIDALTEIHNQRYLLEFLSRELGRSTRYRRPLSLIMFDIDHFKTVNDRYGHLCGDFVLRELSGCVTSTVRKEDLCARYGGEEFALVLPETDREGAAAVAEHVRRAVEAHPFHYDGQVVGVTISLGVSAVSGEEWVTTSELIRQADERLYEAKRQGRNRVAS